MLLTEADGKAILAGAAVPVPQSLEIADLPGLRAAALPFPMALKAQVSAGGRGKVGGIRRCADMAEAETALAEIMALRFGGENPRGVLIEPWLAIERELYLAVTVDGQAGGFVILYAPQGGMEIESGPPPLRYVVGLPGNFRAHQLRALLTPVEEDRGVRERVISLARRLLHIAQARDCITVEINPLVVLKDGKLIAGDAKLVLDDAAAFRNVELAKRLEDERRREPADVQRGQEGGLMLVWLDGNIGMISGGAGLTMATMDAIEAAGGSAACFLDVSGNPTPAGFSLAFDILDNNPQVRSILMSTFGGGLHADRVARTLIDILTKRTSSKPVVIRVNGTRAEIATQILREAGYRNHDTLETAVADVVAVTRRVA